MSFTFDDTLPTPKDEIRFQLNDTDPQEVLLTDEAIAAMIELYGFEGTLVQGCNSIKLFYGKQASSVTLPSRLKASFFDRYKAYADLYEELTAMYGANGTGSTGISAGELELEPKDWCHFGQFQPFNERFGNGCSWRNGW